MVFAGRGVAGKQALDTLPQEFLAKLLVADRARTGRFLEIAGGRHVRLLFPAFVIEPICSGGANVLRLKFLCSAAKQDNQNRRDIQRTEIDSVLKHSRTDAFDVREIACGRSCERCRNFSRLSV